MVSPWHIFRTDDRVRLTDDRGVQLSLMVGDVLTIVNGSTAPEGADITAHWWLCKDNLGRRFYIRPSQLEPYIEEKPVSTNETKVRLIGASLTYVEVEILSPDGALRKHTLRPGDTIGIVHPKPADVEPPTPEVTGRERSWERATDLLGGIAETRDVLALAKWLHEGEEG